MRQGHWREGAIIQPDDSDAAKAGLQSALEENSAALLRFLAARSGDADLAQDLLQDARFRLTKAAPESPVVDPLAYLYRLCDNLVRDHVRSAQRRVVRDSAWSGFEPGARDERAETITPERATLDRDLLKRTLDALDELPERTRDIFLAYRVEGMGQRDIAERHGISLSAVEKHLQRAYRKVIEIRRELDAGDG